MAAEVAVRLDSATVGFQGTTKVGEWAAVTLQVSGPVGQTVDTRVTAADIEGRPVQIAGPTVTLTGAPQAVEIIYQQGPLKSPVAIELLQEGRVLAEQTIHAGEGLVTLTPLTDLVVCLGKAQPGFEAAATRVAAIRLDNPQRAAPLEVRTFTAEQFGTLPRDPRGWHAVDVCVLDASCEPTPEFAATLQAWIMRGGRLVISGGAQIPALEGPVAAWSPIQTSGEVTLRGVSEVNSVLPGSGTLRFREGSRVAARLTSKSGVALIHTQEAAIVVRAGLGAGTVTVICLDLNDPQFVSPAGNLEWDSLPDLCRWLGGMKPITSIADNEQRLDTDLNPTGVSDLQTQLVNSIDVFPQVVRPNYWIILGQCVLFLGLVGAGDFYLVHKVLRRPHLTWVTLPIWIALGGYLGMSSARATSGTEALSRQVDLLTIDAQSQAARVDSWLTLFEPEHRRRAVGYRGDADASPATLRWEGRPEAGFRGLFRETGLHRGEAMTSIQPHSSAIVSWPIRHGSTAVIAAAQESVGPVRVTFDLLDTGTGRLGGKLTIDGPGTIEEWVIAYGNLAYIAPSRNASGLASAGPLAIDLDRCPTKLLTDYLTVLRSKMLAPREKRGPEYLMARTVYDPQGHDLASIFRTLTFHELAGGPQYTTLTNATLRKEDFSHLVRTGRAVLFGRWQVRTGQKATWPGQFLVDQQPIEPAGRESFIRVILPVTPSSLTRVDSGPTAKAP